MPSPLLFKTELQNWIEHVVEPRRLVLAWQAPDQFKERFRWAVGEISQTENDYLFRYFEEAEFQSRNQGKTISAIQELGYRGYPAFNPKQNRHTQNVLAPFLRRIASRGRGDFDSYRSYFRLPAKIAVSDFTLLGITEAKLPGDGFSLVDQLENTEASRELYLEVAGHRYHRSNLPNRDILGEAVEFVREPENLFDQNAVMVQLNGNCIGYINRLQTNAFARWIVERRVSGVVERLNGDSDRPRLFIFVRVLLQPAD